MFRQALDVPRRALGATNPSLAITLNNLAYPLREQGGTTKRLPHSRRR